MALFGVKSSLFLIEPFAPFDSSLRGSVMKTIAIALAVLMLSAATASAGDLAVSESTLEGMGLAGMQQLSDEDGLAVRGKGFFDDVFNGFGGFPNFPDFSFDPPGSTTPPTPSQPESPFDFSPFGGQSLLGDFNSGSQQFGTGTSLGGNTFGFGGNFPWPL
jgi:hypothetical protein